jgi:hypothetical protein
MNNIRVPGQKIINLDAVSSVGFKSTPEGETKAIFNYSHSITLRNGNMVADYTYVFYDNDLKSVMQGVIKAMGKNVLISSDPNHYVINGDHVANIVFDGGKNRIIFNLDYSKEIQLQGGVYTMSSDFCYWDFQNNETYLENVKALENATKFISIEGN